MTITIVRKILCKYRDYIPNLPTTDYKITSKNTKFTLFNIPIYQTHLILLFMSFGNWSEDYFAYLCSKQKI